MLSSKGRNQCNSEAEFVALCEFFVTKFVNAFSKDKTSADLPLVQFAMDIEEELYKKVNWDHPVQSTQDIWSSKIAIAYYNEIADKIFRCFTFDMTLPQP